MLPARQALQRAIQGPTSALAVAFVQLHCDCPEPHLRHQKCLNHRNCLLDQSELLCLSLRNTMNDSSAPLPSSPDI